MPKVAIVLCGCGFKDGSEIHETVLSFLALHEKKLSYDCFSLDEPFLTASYVMKRQEETRNQLEESARIARCEIRNLDTLNSDEYDVIWIPGGFGVASSLSSYAKEGVSGKVHKTLAAILEKFYRQKKTIVALCIAPYIIGMTFQGKNITMTVGTKKENLEVLKKLGHKPKSCKSHEIAVDEDHHIITASGYMEPPDLFGIYQSTRKITEVLCRMK